MRTVLLSSLFSIVLSSTAAASPELAEAWRQQALELSVKLADVTSQSTEMPMDLQAEFQTFGLVSAQLAAAMEDAKGPQDLKCIFDGMAEETGTQIAAVRNNASPEQVDAALARLGYMLADADTVGKAAAIAFRDGIKEEDETVRSCPARPEF